MAAKCLLIIDPSKISTSSLPINKKVLEGENQSGGISILGVAAIFSSVIVIEGGVDRKWSDLISGPDVGIRVPFAVGRVPELLQT